MNDHEPTIEAESPPPEKPKKKRTKSRWRWPVRIVGGLLLFVVILLGAIVAMVTTDPGLELVRRIGVSVGGGFLTGNLEIGAIRGSLLSRLVIEDVRLTDDEGRPAIELDRAELAWNPRALLDGDIIVERLALTGPRVQMVQTSSKGLNLARLVPPSETESPPSDAPLNLPHIVVRSATIDEGDITFDSDGERLATVQGLLLRLNAETKGDHIEGKVERLAADVQDGLPLEMHVGAIVEGEELSVDDLLLTVGEGRLAVPALTTRLPPGPLRGDVELKAPAELVRRLGGPKELLAGADLSLSARRDGDAPRWTAWGGGTLGPTRLGLTATVTESLDTLRAHLDLDGVNPSQLWEGLPKTDLDLLLDADGGLGDTPDIRAKARIDGRIKPDASQPWAVIRALRLDARYQGDRASAKAVGRVADAELDLDAAIADLGLSIPRITKGDLRLVVPEIRKLAGNAASGRVGLVAHVTGPIDDLAAAGSLEGRGIAASGGVKVARADAEWKLDGLPGVPVGDAEVRVKKVELPGRKLDAATLTVRAQSEGQTVDVLIPQLSLSSDDVTWSGKGGHFVMRPSGAMSLEGFDLDSAAGGLAVDADLGPPGPAKGSIDAKLGLRKLDLGRLPKSLVPEVEGLGGVVNGKVDFAKKRGRTNADVDVGLVDFRLAEDRPSVSGTVDATLRPGRIIADVSLDGLAEKIAIHAQAPAPRDATNGAAWSRVMKAGPVEELNLVVEALDLGKVQAFIGQPAEADGEVTVRAEVQESGRTAKLRLRTRKVSFGPPSRPARADLRTRLAFDRGRLKVSGLLDGKRVGRGTFTATVAGPGSLFDAEGWTRIDEKAVKGARIDFDRLRLRALSELGLVEGLSGEASVNVKSGPSLEPLTADVDLRRVIMPWVDGQWGTQLAARVDAKGTSSELHVQLDDKGIIEGTVQAPLPLAKLLKAEPDKLAATPIDAKIDILDLPLPRVVKAAGIDARAVKGTLGGQITAEGAASALKAKLDVASNGMVLGGRRFDLGLEGSFADQKFGSKLDFNAPGTGGIHLTADGGIESEGTSVEAALKGDGLPLRFLSKLGLTPLGLDGGVFADWKVSVAPGKLEPNGWLEVRDIRVVFAQSQLQPLYDGKLRVDTTPQKATLDFAGKSGGGDVTAEAETDISNLQQMPLTAKAKLKGFPVNAGKLAKVDLDIDVDGAVSQKDGTNMTVVLKNGLVDLPTFEKAGRTMLPITSPSEVILVDDLDAPLKKKSATSTSASGAPVVVKVAAESPIVVRGVNLVDAEIDLDVTSRTNVPGQNGVRGRVWVPEGTVTLFENRYRIDRAEVVLEGKQPPDPRLNVTLIHDFTSVGVEFRVRVLGTASEPDLELSSNPARYSRPELLQILLGTDPSELGQSSDKDLGEQAAGAAAGFLAGAIRSELGQILPFDALDVELDGTNVKAVTVGKYLTREIFVATNIHPNADQQTENLFEAVGQYRFLPGWMLELIAGLQMQSLDLLWTNRF